MRKNAKSGQAAAADEAAGGAAAAATPAKPPSRAWHGVLVTGILAVTVVWLLSYTILDLPWQQRFGAWNYLVVVIISSGFMPTLRAWRNDPRRTFGPEEMSPGTAPSSDSPAASAQGDVSPS